MCVVEAARVAHNESGARWCLRASAHAVTRARRLHFSVDRTRAHNDRFSFHNLVARNVRINRLRTGKLVIALQTFDSSLRARF